MKLLKSLAILVHASSILNKTGDFYPWLSVLRTEDRVKQNL